MGDSKCKFALQRPLLRTKIHQHRRMQVLAEPGWCYVVLLAATGGLALSAADTAEDSPAQSTPAAEAPLQRAGSQLSELASDDLADPTEAPRPPWREQALDEAASLAPDDPAPAVHPHEAASRDGDASVKGEAAMRRELFSGFVSFEQLEDTLVRDELERRGATKRPHWVRMRGPGTSSVIVLILCATASHICICCSCKHRF